MALSILVAPIGILFNRFKRILPDMFQDLTLQQFCALDYNRNMVVTAGPGAGKTGILSNRFCFLLLTGQSVSIAQILTLTFTEKAAEEMKGRIYRMISLLERELEAGQNENILMKIRDAREHFNKNRISTIHSFCADLLRENPVESNIDPGFSIIQGVKQRDMMEESIESAISTIWRTNRDILSPLLRSFMNRKNLISAISKIISHPLTYEQAFNTGGRMFKTEGWTHQVFSEYCRCIRDNKIIPYYNVLREIDNSKGQYNDLINLFEEWSVNSEGDQECFGMPDLFASMRQIVDERQAAFSYPSIGEGIKRISIADLIEEFYPDIFRDMSPDSIFEHEFKLFMEAAGLCLEQYRKEKKKTNSLDFADLETGCHSFLTRLSTGDRLQLKRIQRGFKYIMVDEFQDTNIVQWDIIRLLCAREGACGKDVLQPGKLFVVGDKRQAIYRFRGGDVTVFETVMEEIKASNSDTRTNFFWQQGDKDDLLAAVCKEYPELKKKHADLFESMTDEEKDKMLAGNIYLPHNFRSDTCPIDFFNSAFKEIFGNKGAGRIERYETAHRALTMPETKGIAEKDSGSVAVYLTASLRKDAAGKEAALIADIIAGILGMKGLENREYAAYKDIREKIKAGQKAIGILLFRFSHVKIFEAIFREAGFPFMIHRGKGFYRCQEVMEIVQLLNYLSDERQRISLLSTLRSPLFGLTDAEVFDLFYGVEVAINMLLASDNAYVRQAGETLRSWRFLSNRLTIAELIRTIITDRALTAIYSIHPNGQQRKANVDKLIETSRRFQSEGNGSLTEFVEYCLTMADEEEEEGEAQVITGEDCPITIMTVHAAKGLEFPMVMIPDLDHRPPLAARPGIPLRLYPSEKTGQNRWNSVEGIIPVWQVEIPGLGHIRKYSPLGYLLSRRNRLEDIAENRRVFYVACTRAMNHLILIGSMKKRLMEKEAARLSSDDYKERATIMEILDDVYDLSLNSFPDKEDCVAGSGGKPWILWREPESRDFHGINYNNDSFLSGDFGAYNDKIKRLDLTSPIVTPSYFQISFKSLSVFKECPRKFYLNVILGARQEEPGHAGIIEGEEKPGREAVREEDEMDTSGSALMLGLLVHGYLERHHFGGGFNDDLFNRLWEKSLVYKRGEIDLDKDLLGFLKEKARGQLENTIKDERLIKTLSGTPDFPEASFLINISPGIDFRGVIDRVFRNRDKDCWSIIDWKSNDLKGRKPGDIAEENNYFLQLACYKYAVERITNERVDGLYIYFTGSRELLESNLRFDAGDFISEVSGKISEYSGKGLPPRDLECDNSKMLKCRFCGYQEGFCKGK
jgi:ATP-dependent helicase/nuclease subunit A